MKTFVGLILLLLGLSLFVVSFFSITRTDTVIDISFVLDPGEKYEPYGNGTYYHTRVISKSTLSGEVVAVSGGINFTANGYNTQHLKNVFINQNHSFIIDPADDLYTFTFDNTGNDIPSSIKFTLKEKWMNLLSLIPAFIILLITAPAGIALIIVGLRQKTGKSLGSLKVRGNRFKPRFKSLFFT
ncbi:MAG: hypothetical protein ACE5L6_01475 [Candidatus Bathyarchaeia archaeon]